LALRTVTLVAHESLPEHAFGFVLIVRTATKSKVRDRRAATSRDGRDVIELDPSPAPAAAAR
jgi:hypothetical protein